MKPPDTNDIEIITVECRYSLVRNFASEIVGKNTYLKVYRISRIYNQWKKTCRSDHDTRSLLWMIIGIKILKKISTRKIIIIMMKNLICSTIFTFTLLAPPLNEFFHTDFLVRQFTTKFFQNCKVDGLLPKFISGYFFRSINNFQSSSLIFFSRESNKVSKRNKGYDFAEAVTRGVFCIHFHSSNHPERKKLKIYTMDWLQSLTNFCWLISK